MDLSNLTPAEGAIRKRRRRGRGHAAGRGKTCGRGHKGLGARSGGKQYAGFEGGQMPLQRRIPKRGFNNKWRVAYTAVNISDLESLAGVDEFDVAILKDAGLVRGHDTRVKILGDGDVTRAIKVKAHAFSKSAREKIVAAGGTAEEIA